MAVTGAAIQAPLRLVPENAIKFLVGSMVLAFGSFWTVEATAPDAWPLGDWSLPALTGFYLAGGLVLVRIFRAPT